VSKEKVEDRRVAKGGSSYRGSYSYRRGSCKRGGRGDIG